MDDKMREAVAFALTYPSKADETIEEQVGHIMDCISRTLPQTGQPKMHDDALHQLIADELLPWLNIEPAERAADRILSVLPPVFKPQTGQTAEGWMDISSAPKDGTEILATDGTQTLVVRWESCPPAHPTHEDYSGWHDRYSSREDQCARLLATQWHPLQVPPAAKEPSL